MCRLLAYLGPPIQLERLIYDPEHSLIVQSYQPKEMEVAVLNGDGVGLGWYHPHRQEVPYVYRNTLPAWNDVNLPHLCRYIEAGNVLAHVRSATPGLAVDLHNCQPFSSGRVSFIHNGYIENFRHSLYRPIRDSLPDPIYQTIHGLTDSEHIFAMVVHRLESGASSLTAALQGVIHDLDIYASGYGVRVMANIVLSDGDQLAAGRYDSLGKSPSLYWLQNHEQLPDSFLLASEPLFSGNWQPFPEHTLMTVTCDGDPVFRAIAPITPEPTTLPGDTRTASAA